MSKRQEMESALFAYLSQYIALTAEEQKAIVELSIFKTFSKGTVLLREGQRSRESYFVLKLYSLLLHH